MTYFRRKWIMPIYIEPAIQAMLALKAQQVEFILHVVGQRFRIVPEVFFQINAQLSGHLGQ